MSYQTTEQSGRPQSDLASAYIYQRQQDEDHLRMLSIFHYILGGLTLLWATFCLIYVFLGAALGAAMVNPTNSVFSHAGQSASGILSNQMMGWLFIYLYGGFAVAGWALGGLTIYSGSCIKNRTKSAFSLVIAALNCLSVPLGTLLGVFTLIVLARPSVKGIYDPGLALEPSGAYQDR